MNYAFIPINLILNFLKCLICKGFLLKYANMSYVEHYFTLKYLGILGSLINRSVCWHAVYFYYNPPLHLFSIELNLYCIYAMLYHNNTLADFGNVWSTINVTISASVEIFVLIFWFIEIVWIYTLTMVNIPPVWMFISECTAKAELEYQYLMVTLLIFNASLISSVSWR